VFAVFVLVALAAALVSTCELSGPASQYMFAGRSIAASGLVMLGWALRTRELRRQEAA